MVEINPLFDGPGQITALLAAIFAAEMNVIVVFSACPQDIMPINGLLRRPTDAHYPVF